MIKLTGSPAEPPKEPDWVDILKTLKKRGYTQVAIEHFTGIKQTVVSRMGLGKQKNPTYRTGTPIMKLFRKSFKKRVKK